MFSSSSSLSDFEILALISSIDVKLKLSLFEDWVHLLRRFESLIKDIQNRKDIVLSEVLKQYNQYFKSKLIIEEEIYRNKICLSAILRYSLKFIHFLKMLNANISRYPINLSNKILCIWSSFMMFMYSESPGSKLHNRKISDSFDRNSLSNLGEKFGIDLPKDKTEILNLIFRCLFSSKYIDSRLFWYSLELLDKLYELRQQPVFEWHEVHLLKDLFNIQKDWNVSIVYHPSYLEIYRYAQSYLNLIKEALGANDLFSLFAYNRDKLKNVISTQKISNLNFEESLSTYSCNDTLLHKKIFI